MNKEKYLVACLLGVLSLVSTGSNAAILSVDDSVFGRDSVTRDTISGLEWLDVSLSAGFSYNQVISEQRTGGAFEGWRVATIDEFNSFLSNAVGFDVTLETDFYYELNTFDHIVDLLSPTVQLSGWVNIIEGYFSDVVSNLSGDYVYTGNLRDHVSLQDYWKPRGAIQTKDLSHHQIGTFMLRSSGAVSEPSTIGLMLIGVIGLAGIRAKSGRFPINCPQFARFSLASVGNGFRALSVTADTDSQHAHV